MSATDPEALLEVARASLVEAGEADAEVYAVSTTRGVARVAVGEVGEHASIEEPEAQVRVARGARVGESSTSDLTLEGITRAIGDAAAMAELAPPRDPWPGFTEPAAGAAPISTKQQGDAAPLDPSARAAALAPILASIRGAGLVSAGALQSIEIARAIANTRGLARAHRASIVTARLWALETAGAGGAAGFDSAAARSVEGLHLSALTARAIRDANDAKASFRPLPAGRYDVVLEAEAVASLLEWLSMIAFGAIEVEQGSSPFAGRIGERITGEHVSIHEDPLERDAPLAVAPFDREGTARRRVTLLDHGVVRAFLHDRTTARRMSSESTGSAARGWSWGITPLASAIRMDGGEAEGVDGLLAKMQNGLHVRRFHYVNGFLEPRRAVMTGLTRDGTFLVEGGKRVASVGNLRFTDSILEAFGRIEALTREVRVVGSHFSDEVPVRAPAILLRGLQFSTGSPS